MSLSMSACCLPDLSLWPCLLPRTRPCLPVPQVREFLLNMNNYDNGGHFSRWHSCNPAADQRSDPMWPTPAGPLLCTIWKSLANNIFMIHLHNLFFGRLGWKNLKEKFVNVKTLKMSQSKPKQVFITEMDKTWNKTFQSDLKWRKRFLFLIQWYYLIILRYCLLVSSGSKLD